MKPLILAQTTHQTKQCSYYIAKIWILLYGTYLTLVVDVISHILQALINKSLLMSVNISLYLSHASNVSLSNDNK